MNGWTPKDKKQAGLQPVSGIVTDTVIGSFAPTAGGSKNLRVDVKVSSVTQVGTLTLKIRGAVTGSDTFTALAGVNASQTFTADGIVSLTQNIEIAADQANMPLLPTLQITLTTTNAGDAVTVDNVWVTQED